VDETLILQFKKKKKWIICVVGTYVFCLFLGIGLIAVYFPILITRSRWNWFGLLVGLLGIYILEIMINVKLWKVIKRFEHKEITRAIKAELVVASFRSIWNIARVFLSRRYNANSSYDPKRAIPGILFRVLYLGVWFMYI
jgi:hypothetical protein